MRLPRWNRRQKTVRNFLLILLTLLLLGWSSGFPSWTLDGLLRRAERKYLLEDSTPLFQTDSVGEGYELYAWNHGQILQVYYDHGLMGYWLDAARLFDEEIGVFGGIDLAAGKQDGYYPIRLFAFGDMADAASAEMDVTVSYTSNQIVSTCTVQGERAAENCWRFDVERQYDDRDTGELAQWEREIFSGSQKDRYSGTLRLYDGDGALLRSWDFDKFQQLTMQWEG